MGEDRLIVAICAWAGMLVTGISYQWGGRKGWYTGWLRLLLKGGTTLIAALLALYGALHSGLAAHRWIALGIAVCAAADVTLEKHFVLGMGNFALGHFCFIAAFLMLRPLQPLSLIVMAVIALGVIVVIPRLRPQTDQPLLPFALYALIIGMMLALALVQRPLAAAGAALFVISDAMIAYRLLRPAGRLNDDLCISFYYSAQFLLALATIY